jgi:sodium transport system permease protein
MSILLPMILFPLISYFMGNSMKSMQVKQIKVAVNDAGKSSLGVFLRQQKDILVVGSGNINGELQQGKIMMAISIPDNFDQNLAKDIKNNVVITYDNSSQQSEVAMSKVNTYITQYSGAVVKDRLAQKNIDTDIVTPIAVQTKTPQKEAGVGRLLLSLILPLLLFIYCATGPMAAATDLGAGEKERGTLEPLLSTQAGRMPLVWGKFLAISLVGFITTAASILGVYIATLQSNGIFSSISGGSISVLSIVLIGIYTMLTTMVFGAIELSISIYARSFKEAQTYLSPLLLLSFIPAYATYMLDARNISEFYFNIPLANIVCLIKQFVVGIYDFRHILVTSLWIVVYIILAISLARYMFNKENVIFRT